MRRILAVCFSLSLLLAAVPAQAQLGGLKKKLSDKVTGKKPDTTVTASGIGGRPKCDNSSLVITADVVDRYLKGWAAQAAETRRLAREKGPVGEYYAAYYRRQEVERRKQEFDLRRGKDWERYKLLYVKFVKGDQVAMAQQRALTDSLDPNQVQVPTVDWSTQTEHNKRLDSLAIAGSGLSACDWGAQGLGERIPRMVAALVNDPDTKDFQGYGTQAEGAAVKARLKELADALGYSQGRGTGSYTEAEKAHIKDEDEKLQQLAMQTGDPYTDCVTKSQQEFYKKHQAELEKASKDRDMAASQRLSLLMAQESAKECKKYSKDQDDDE